MNVASGRQRLGVLDRRARHRAEADEHAPPRIAMNCSARKKTRPMTPISAADHGLGDDQRRIMASRAGWRASRAATGSSSGVSASVTDERR